ncbi:ABC transporter ATP-binding protein [Nitratidesulfovibrio sp. SRB-5]|uniref:ABC transporter ATP-binding protein n=1 Tax=Nitratidesulfovibrio sp. SRB-5 TaxID=2872636 RepID=UPI0010277E71|nr:ABC transporter ATP-binding protein [Nitratidesulfovibrio sp. SRB-5]MBZ2172015.1 ABC transporter ATP-binding protein [Nitratidesulfovibrio sp. SRB-5]RXF77526.1 ABC transporter ATP-binding protein [Desulfovibrio sp. DS-1]
MQPLLDVSNLTVKFALRDTALTAVNDVSFTLAKGERLGLVGESGAGKSVTGFSILNLVSKPGFIAGGSVLFEGKDLTTASAETLRDIRGNRISMIFQDPMMTLNPVLTVGTQMIETILAHKKVTRKEAEAIALDKLRKVYIPSPERRLAQYPHEFSGGMRQRIVIAIALLTSPSLIIADEPTTALDVTIQAEIMDLLLELCQSEDMGLILITHDLGVVSQVTQKIAVMYAGGIVEMGDTARVVGEPLHPYTRGLLGALPQCADKADCGLADVAAPRARRRLNQIPGSMPSLSDVPRGCPFNNRCELCETVCTTTRPLLEKKSDGRMAACHMVA